MSHICVNDGTSATPVANAFANSGRSPIGFYWNGCDPTCTREAFANNYLEELFLHEAVHATIDEFGKNDAGDCTVNYCYGYEYAVAIVNDHFRPSEYSGTHGEDRSESLPLWLAKTYRLPRMTSTFNLVSAIGALPHRFAHFDKMYYHKCAYPMEANLEKCNVVGGVVQGYVGWKHIAHKHLAGYNDVHLTYKTVDECKYACEHDYPKCLSFDYYNGWNKCDLSFTAPEESALYWNGGPYDHYQLLKSS